MHTDIKESLPVRMKDHGKTTTASTEESGEQLYENERGKPLTLV